ncbi:MAG: FAD-dependent oxidoreductase [Phycisphaerae bacterium]|nr:FAD-dependent oxidoreductase [Phycisphaerae bacterium]
MSEHGHDTDDLRFASLTAHQLQSPISSVRQILDMLQGGFNGPLTAAQKEQVEKAIQRCDQGIEAIQRMLEIAREDETDLGAVDLAKLAQQAVEQYRREASRRGISLALQLDAEPAPARGRSAALSEAISAMLNNALKYTPDNGQIRVTVWYGAEKKTCCLSVADSGVGIDPEEREKVFEPFFRASTQRRSARPGTGIGLAFVRAVVVKAGGAAWADQSRLGGAEIFIELPCAALPEPVEAPETPPPMRVVIVGGVAAGPKVASKIIRLAPHAEVTVVERGRILSYAGCGLPYYVSGVVREERQLMATPVGAVRDPVFFQSVKNVSVLNQTEAVEIDRNSKRLRVCSLSDGKETWLDYDKLVLATGATPILPDIPNNDLGNIFRLHGVRDAEGIKAVLSEPKSHDVVIVGGGLIGVEATEALVRRGCRVTIVEKLPQIMPMLDWEIAKLIERHLESHGVKVLTKTQAESFHPNGNGKVASVRTSAATLSAEMVIVAVGVKPEVTLARQAGLDIGETGAIRVDDRMRTSDPDIFAAGDCVECVGMLTGRATYVPLGSTANKQGRVAAVNICGGDDHFPGILGSTICRVFDYCAGRTGLNESVARELGFDVVSVLAPAPDREHFMPEAKMLFLKLVVDRKTRRLLGAQVTGPGEGDKRIQVAAMAITAGMTVDQLANADLCYAPSYSSAMDNIITAANVARNKLDGIMAGVSPIEVHRMMRENTPFTFLDVRTPGEHEQLRLPHAKLIPLGSLRGRLGELPADEPIVTFGELSLRGYEAALILKTAGFKDVRVMDGGTAMWPFEKLYG